MDDVKPMTVLLKNALKLRPAFSGVDNAQVAFAKDANSWEPNVLQFTYRELPYFAHVRDDGVRIARPGGSAEDRPVGKPIPWDTEGLVDAIARTIDEAKLE